MYESVRALVRTILENPHGREWSVQGLGMLRTYLTESRTSPPGEYVPARIHIWDESLRTPNVSTIHDHPWGFRSLVLAGMVRQVRFRPVGEAEPEDSLLRRPYQALRIQCGPGGGPCGDPLTTRLRALELEEYGPGRAYQQAAHEIHDSFPESGTVTLVSRMYGDDVDHATVYWEAGEWVDAEPRPATREEIARVCGKALEGWDVIS